VSRPVKYETDRVSTTVRLDAQMLQRVDAAAEERGVGRNWLIEHFIADGMERLIPVEELRLTRKSER